MSIKLRQLEHSIHNMWHFCESKSNVTGDICIFDGPGKGITTQIIILDHSWTSITILNDKSSQFDYLLEGKWPSNMWCQYCLDVNKDIELTIHLTTVWHLCQTNEHSAWNKDISSWYVTFDISWFLIFVKLSCKVLILCGLPCHQDEWNAAGAIFKCCMNLSFNLSARLCTAFMYSICQDFCIVCFVLF